MPVALRPAEMSRHLPALDADVLAITLRRQVCSDVAPL
jgi:hypothetical protein